MKQDPTIGFFKSFLLFLIALLLLVTTTPIGFLYTLIRQFVLAKFKTLGAFFIESAIALDMAGNVMMQHLLNDCLLVKKKDTYYFGNKKETISSVIGKNNLVGSLSATGRALNAFLNLIDKGHTFDSIIYDVKILR
jgi:hypothetical protein